MKRHLHHGGNTPHCPDRMIVKRYSNGEYIGSCEVYQVPRIILCGFHMHQPMTESDGVVIICSSIAMLMATSLENALLFEKIVIRTRSCIVRELASRQIFSGE